MEGLPTDLWEGFFCSWFSAVQLVRVRLVSKALKAVVETSLSRCSKVDFKDLYQVTKGDVAKKTCEVAYNRSVFKAIQRFWNVNLVDLVLNHRQVFIDQTLVNKIVETCKNLEGLTLQSNFVEPSTLLGPALVIQGLPKLERLDLENVHFDYTCLDPDNVSFQLRHFGIIKPIGNTDLLGPALVKTNSLTSLTLHDVSPHCEMLLCSNFLLQLTALSVKDVGVIGGATVSSLEKLRTLKAENVTLSPGLIAALPSAKELTCLDLSDIKDLSDVALEAIAKSCSQLRTVKLDQVSHFGFSAFAQHCHDVETLSAVGCKGVADYTLVTAGQNCKRLKTINIGYCEGVSDQGIQGLCEHASLTLKDITLDGCVQLTDRSVVCLSLKCANLERLSLRGVSRITDTSILSLAKHLTKLRVLDVGWCFQVSTGALSQLYTDCFAFSHLEAQGCSHLNFDTLEMAFRSKINRRPPPEPITKPQVSKKKSKKAKKSKTKMIDLEAMLNSTEEVVKKPVAKKPAGKEKKSKRVTKKDNVQEASPLSKWK